MTPDFCNKIFLKKGQNKAVGTYLYLYIYFLVLTCRISHGNNSADVAHSILRKGD